MAKSHRTSNDKELIRWDQDYAKIKGRDRKKRSTPHAARDLKKGEKSTFFWFQQKQKQGRIEKGIHAIAVACIPTSQKREVNFNAGTG